MGVPWDLGFGIWDLGFGGPSSSLRLGLRHRDSFRHLLDAARHVHESYATFASTQLALVEHHNANDILAAYPMYRRLYQAVVALIPNLLEEK